MTYLAFNCKEEEKGDVFFENRDSCVCHIKNAKGSHGVKDEYENTARNFIGQMDFSKIFDYYD